MPLVTFAITARLGEELPDPVVIRTGRVPAIPRVDDYVFLDRGGPEYKVVSITHTFEGFHVISNTLAESKALADIPYDDHEGDPIPTLDVYQETTVMLRLVNEHEEEAEGFGRGQKRQADIAAYEASQATEGGAGPEGPN